MSAREKENRKKWNYIEKGREIDSAGKRVTYMGFDVKLHHLAACRILIA